RKGEQFLPDTFNSRKVFGNNCVFDMSMSRNERPIDKVLTSYKNTINTGKYTEDDIAVLSPTKKGTNGTVAINNRIQSFINPRKSFGNANNEFSSITDGIDVVFRKGDRILNKKNRKGEHLYSQTPDKKYFDNSRKTDIVNGDIGHIVSIEGKYVYTKFDESILRFSISDFNNQSIIHGWAITGHKSQGSEFKVVICLFERSSKFQMNGNLLYTMTSRAKDLLLVLGDISTINSSLKKFENTSRETNLLDFFNLKNN
ncbi:MAG: ATP-binding domain-containing protein, partial [Lactococcus hircilactis]